MSEGFGPKYNNILNRLFAGYCGPALAVRLWNGWHWASQNDADPKCTIVVQSPRALLALIADPNDVTLGEAFITKEIDVEGDLLSVFAATEHIFHHAKSRTHNILRKIGSVFSRMERWWEKGKLHSPERDSSAISYHYDQPVEFYRPWLGNTLAYSCGYFSSPDDSLDTAQVNKLELICRKLRLKSSDRFLDIGCGWGSLVLHAASHYSALARGITLSRVQAEVANARIEQSHLISRSSVELLDYRATPQHFGIGFDKIASVGMFEHVGLCHLRDYFHIAYDLLRPGGVFLNHGIAAAWSDGTKDASGLEESKKPSFIDKYVFPDGQLVTLSETIRTAESVGFEVRDVENLREHYELTLKCWIDALQKNAEEVRRYVSERVYRIWLLYMAGCAAAFRRGDIALYQIVFSRPDHGRSGLPLVRDDWYREFSGSGYAHGSS